MDYGRFLATAKRARSTRTKADALVLLAEYAESGCATYPVDSRLFVDLWGTEGPPGFVLTPYHLMSHIVTQR